MHASFHSALVLKGCNFIAPLALIQQFLRAHFSLFFEHCGIGMLNIRSSNSSKIFFGCMILSSVNSNHFYQSCHCRPLNWHIKSINSCSSPSCMVFIIIKLWYLYSRYIHSALKSDKNVQFEDCLKG